MAMTKPLLLKDPNEGSGFKKLILPIFLPQLPAYMVNMMLMPLLPAFVMHHFHLGPAMAGITVSCMFWAPVVLNIPSNIIVDKVGPHNLGIFASICLIACGLLGVVSVGFNCFPLLLLARIFNGAGQQTWQISRVLLVARGPAQLRGTAMSIVGGLQRCGGALGPFLGGHLASCCTINTVFLAQAIVGLMVFPMALLPVLLPAAVPDFIRGSGVGASKDQTSARGMLTCFRRNWLRYTTAGGTLFILNVLRLAKDFLIVMRIKTLQGGLKESSLAVTMAYTFDVLCSPLSGVLMNRGRKLSMGCAMLVLGIACGLLGTPLANTFSAVNVIACLAGAGNGLSSGLAMTVGSDIAVALEKDGLTVSKAEFLGPWRELMDLGMLMGPMITGAIISSFSLMTGAGVLALLGVMSVAFMLVFVEETYVPTTSKT